MVQTSDTSAELTFNYESPPLGYFMNRRDNDPQLSYVLYALLFNWIAAISACAAIALAFFKI